MSRLSNSEEQGENMSSIDISNEALDQDSIV